MICAVMSRTWLGGRDSNPDTVVQSHVSYRWTTSQYQSGVREGQELSIISARKQGRQARQTGTGHQLLTRNVVHRAALAGIVRVAALARNLALFASVHRRKSTILFGHHALLAYTRLMVRANTRAATDVPHLGR